MTPIRLLSAAEQVAEHLREWMARGLAGEGMPGIHQLAADLGANHKTVAAALRQLEKEGAAGVAGGRPAANPDRKPSGCRAAAAGGW